MSLCTPICGKSGSPALGGYAICLTIIQNVTAADEDRIWLVVLCEKLASTWLKLLKSDEVWKRRLGGSWQEEPKIRVSGASRDARQSAPVCLAAATTAQTASSLPASHPRHVGMAPMDSPLNAVKILLDCRME